MRTGRAILTAALTALLLWAIPGIATAAPVHVSAFGNDASGDGSIGNPFATVQRAVNAASPGDDVLVGGGDFVGNVVMKDGVSIYGSESVTTTLRGTGSGSVVVVDGIGGGETIAHFTITGGAAGLGGGIYCSNSSPTIDDNVINGNSASGGGGIGAVDSSPVITGNTVSGNTANQSGAGIACYRGTPTVTDNEIRGNTTPQIGGGMFVQDCVGATIRRNLVADNVSNGAAGGIYCYNSAATIDDNTIYGNTATHTYSSGGGISVWGAAAAVVTGNNIFFNTANDGAGIYASNSAPLIKDNTIHENSARYSGGGIYAESNGAMLIGNTIFRNTAAMGGGVITNGSVTLMNNTIYRNAAPTYYGGGLACFYGSPVITNNTITGNTSSGTGAGIYGYSTTAVMKNCIVWGNGAQDLNGFAGTYSNIGSGLTAGVGNVTTAPGFVNAAVDDYRLLATAPGIDTGMAVGAPATDKRGVYRPQGAGVDMGAFEYYSPTTAAPTDPTLSSATHPAGTWKRSTQPVVTLSGASSSVAPLAGFAISVTENAEGPAGNTITHGSGTTSYSFTAQDGVYYVNVATRDILGNWSDGVHYGPIRVDSTKPTVLGDAPTDWVSADTTLTVRAVEAGSGFDSFDWERVGPDGTSGGWSARNPIAFSVSAEGTTTISYTAVDKAGNRSSVGTSVVRIDKSGPTNGSVVINDGDLYTDTPDVTLALAANDVLSGVDAMRISEDGTFDTEPWEPFAPGRAWSLSAGDGLKTVFVRYRDLAGNETGAVSSSIMLDHPPVARDDSMVTFEDTPLMVAAPGVLVNDSDALTEAKSPTLITPPLFGSLTLNADGSFIYNPDAESSGTDRFTYIVSDGGLWSAPATCTITVHPVNDAPRDIALSNTTIDENAGAFMALGHLSALDPDAGETFSYSLVPGDDSSAFAIIGDELRAIASFDYETKSSYSVTVRVTDSEGAALEKPFTITVVDRNDAPTDITCSALAIAENDPEGTAVGTLDAADQDEADTHTYEIVGGADDDSFAIDGDRLIATRRFDHEAKPALAIRILVRDAAGEYYVKQLEIAVTDVDEAPVAAMDSFTTDEDTVLRLPFTELLGNDADPEDEALSAMLADNAIFGVVTPGILSMDYMPADDYYGSDEFTYLAFDGFLYSLPAPVAITVNPVNDAPSFTAGADITVAEDSAAFSADWASDIAAGPANEVGQALSFETTNNAPTLFAVQPEVGADGKLSFTPAPDANGTATVTAKLTDDDTEGGSALSVTRTLSITLAPVADPTTLSVTSSSAVLASAGDTYAFTGKLESKGAPAAGAQVTLQYSYDGVQFVNTSMKATTESDGSFGITVKPTRKIHYRARFEGETGMYGASESGSVVVTPRAFVGTVVAPETMYAGQSANAFGYLKPRHEAGTRPVRVYRYRYESGAWKSYGFVLADASDYGSYTKYTASLSLPSAGQWRLRSYSPADEQHAASWSSSYDYVTVKSRGELAVAIAYTHVGSPFTWGANGPSAFDSSGFVRHVYESMGVSLPRTATEQYAAGPKVSTKSLKPGDLLFFYSPVSHVGIYAGDGMMIDCNRPGGGVRLRSVYPGLVGATRPVQ